MVKLLRLTSRKSDDVNAPEGLEFNVNMDADLIVSEKAQIAVKNITFEDDFDALVVGADTLLVTFFESARLATATEPSTRRD